MSGSRNELRTTFDRDALLYDAVRPGYPEALFADLIALSGIPSAGQILEIGCGTGQATLPLARRGYHLLAVELGARLAEVARHNLAAFPNVRIEIGAFEDWPLDPESFDLVFAATSFHWLDPAVAFPKIARALRPGGAIALCWNVHVRTDANAEFFAAVQELYDQTPMGGDGPPPLPHEIGDRSDEIAETGLFGPITARRYPWQITYDTATYLQLLSTYSNHIALTPDTRARLFAGIAGLIDHRFGGHITKDYLAVLYVARKEGGE